MTGRIVKGISGFYYIFVAGSGIYECKAKGAFRKQGLKPLVGDQVEIDVLDEAEHLGNVVRILPRKNALIRPAVANVDQALVIFAAASITDWFDGKLARKYNLVTNFGKFMDPLADKLLVCSAMICMIDLKRLPAWFVIIIIAREFIISGFRLIAAENGIVIAANYWGKFKTASQMIMIILLILHFDGIFVILEQIFIWLSLALTIISLITYIWQNRTVLSMQE